MIKYRVSENLPNLFHRFIDEKAALGGPTENSKYLPERLACVMLFANCDTFNLSAELKVLLDWRIVSAIVNVLNKDTALVGVILRSILTDVILGVGNLALFFFAYASIKFEVLERQLNVL